MQSSSESVILQVQVLFDHVDSGNREISARGALHDSDILEKATFWLNLPHKSTIARSTHEIIDRYMLFGSRSIDHEPQN